ncbi:MAG: hypothetical protein CVV45_01315 [Spirochaetae bacterium HGW-Spirochaetae-10]|nr:MAG: hypothetical protein CVV45_01315 [Spirochaetae bacterium HGW-Spirochaetae-10]
MKNVNRFTKTTTALLGLLAITGWGAFARLFWFSNTKQVAASVSKRVDCAPIHEEWKAKQQEVTGMRLMEVYVRPHPPDFKVGRWIRFTRYDTLSDGRVKFYDGNAESAVVLADSIDWPGVRKLP